MLAIWELMIIKQKAIPNQRDAQVHLIRRSGAEEGPDFFFLEKPHLTRVDWVKNLKQSILFRFVAMRNTSNNCGALNIRLKNTLLHTLT